MLNEERIRLMTKMAAFEEGQGKEYMPIKQYYRKDYLAYQMIRTFISSTIAFGILFLLGMLYSMNDVAENLASMDLLELGTVTLVEYIVFVVVYQFIAYAVYRRKYNRATREMKLYQSRLKKVIRLQEREERMQSEERE